MTTEQLKNFLAVAEVLNFHKASATSYIAQPALSRQIQNLEAEVGAELFDRSKKQIRLTAAGEFFKNEVTRILKHLAQVQKMAGQIHRGEAGEIMIGHVSSAMYSVLPFFLKTMTTSYPHLKIRLHEDSCGVICNKILDRELHFGITPDEVKPDRMGSTMLYKENFVAVMPKNMKVNLKTFNLKALANADWILPSREDGQAYHDQLSKLFHKSGFTPRVYWHYEKSAGVVLKCSCVQMLMWESSWLLSVPQQRLE